MKILFHVATGSGGRYLLPLARACARGGHAFGAFFTHDGVLALRDERLRAALAPAVRAVVCETSWHRYCPGVPCPVEAGSQTSNSMMIGDAQRVVSL